MDSIEWLSQKSLLISKIYKSLKSFFKLAEHKTPLEDREYFLKFFLIKLIRSNSFNPCNIEAEGLFNSSLKSFKSYSLSDNYNNSKGLILEANKNRTVKKSTYLFGESSSLNIKPPKFKIKLIQNQSQSTLSIGIKNA